MSKKDDEKKVEAPESVEELTALFGFEPKDRLGTKAIRALRKSLPGCASVLAHATEKLEKEATLQHVRGASVADLSSVVAERRIVADAEAILEVAHRTAYEQRLVLDDSAMDILRRLNKAVNVSCDPELQRRWEFLRSYLAAFNGGPKKKSKSADAGEPK